MKRLWCLMLCTLLLFLTGCAGEGRDSEIASLAPDETNRLTIYTSHK